ncbi:MAG: phosphoribosylformylglycinamidine synthase subunit PurQ [Verrucomicrobiota bacterium]
MRAAVIQFPGSNCDQDCFYAMERVLGVETFYLWHKETDLRGAELIIVPGGFSYGDYLRAGAIAHLSPVMGVVKAAAAEGRVVMGICNGFQVLCESGLLPGALIRNRGLRFVCEHRLMRVEHSKSIFTRKCRTGQLLNLPIAHGEGNFFADEATLTELQSQHRILFTYSDAHGIARESANPNGSRLNIAGITNQAGNVLGMMPHPERAAEAVLGSADGWLILSAALEHAADLTVPA